MVLKLFEGSDTENNDVSKISNIEIDREYAKRYEHNKKREDLERLQELKKKGLIQSSDSSRFGSGSESDDDDDVDLVNSSKRDKEFFDAPIKVKKQDPLIKNKDMNLFASEESGDDDENNNNNKKNNKNKAMYLKDVVAKHLIEEGLEFEEEEREMEKKKKSYVEEQEDIRREFLKAVENEEDGEGEFLKMKENGDEGEEEEEGGEFVRKLDEYFGGDGELEDEGSKFLKGYFWNRMWVDKERKSRKVGEKELEHVLEDEREIERQEEYEYRFQENVGDRVMGHSRKVEGSVRKKENARKEQRRSKEERREAIRVEREEELKHLKNLKKEEMDEKVRRIMWTVGIKEDEVVELSRKELEEEFDPEECDRMMEKEFREEYYGKEDLDPKFGSGGDEDEDEGEIEKPEFEEEDELHSSGR